MILQLFLRYRENHAVAHEIRTESHAGEIIAYEFPQAVIPLVKRKILTAAAIVKMHMIRIMLSTGGFQLQNISVLKDMAHLLSSLSSPHWLRYRRTSLMYTSPISLSILCFFTI